MSNLPSTANQCPDIVTRANTCLPKRGTVYCYFYNLHGASGVTARYIYSWFSVIELHVHLPPILQAKQRTQNRYRNPPQYCSFVKLIGVADELLIVDALSLSFPPNASICSAIRRSEGRKYLE